jgi:hypothetical protein
VFAERNERSRVIRAQIKQAIVINDSHSEIPQPALTTQHVARQTRKLGKVNSTLARKLARLEKDVMTKGIH